MQIAKMLSASTSTSKNGKSAPDGTLCLTLAHRKSGNAYVFNGKHKQLNSDAPCQVSGGGNAIFGTTNEFEVHPKPLGDTSRQSKRFA